MKNEDQEGEIERTVGGKTYRAEWETADGSIYVRWNGKSSGPVYLNNIAPERMAGILLGEMIAKDRL